MVTEEQSKLWQIIKELVPPAFQEVTYNFIVIRTNDEDLAIAFKKIKRILE